ncbi:multidrug resistance-associated protein 1-like [Bacillus rossius redtenbacheri]|uniref:multidrug resistance-associated protein 1-like n=1 Tax=Bacillus rossius redtenbacheri TaxID=93214 RepID=UPI002FDDD037
MAQTEGSSLIEQYCGSKFWDDNLTFHASDPDLTPCFQQTVLVWVPCAFLLALSSVEATFLAGSRARHVPWTLLNVAKLMLTCLLSVLCIIDIGFTFSFEAQGYQMNIVDYVTPAIKFVTLVVCCILQYYNKKKGLRTSGVLFIFWFLLALFGAVQFRYEIRNLQNEEPPDPIYPSISYIVFYAITLVMFLLNFLLDAVPKESEYEDMKRPCPEVTSPFPINLLFLWFDKFVWRTYRSSVSEEELWDLKPEESSKSVVPRFEKHWNKAVRKSRDDVLVAKLGSKSGSLDFKQHEAARAATVLPALCRAFGATFLSSSVLMLCNVVVTFVNPQILSNLIAFVSSDDPFWLGIVYAVLMLVFALLQPMFSSHGTVLVMKTAVRARTALISIIYRKALTMSNNAKKESTVGEIVNLMSVDATRVYESVIYLNWAWMCPLQIAVALYFLWQRVGIAALSGLGVMLLLIPLNVYVASKVKTLQVAQMKIKDQRLKMMNEILGGMKVLKLYAWERSFEERVEQKRQEEVRILRHTAYLNAATSFIWTCAPLLVSLLTFTTYVLMDENNELDPQTAFVSVSLFNLIRAPLAIIPIMVANIIQANVSLKRINKYLATEDIDMTSVSHDKQEKVAVSVRAGWFAWGRGQEPVLRGVSVVVPEGSLVAVVGTVGSGKSSLVSAMLGEMDVAGGSVNTTGSTAYVPQQAWIQNATLRDNIVFGRPLDHAFYQRVIDACSLRSDLAILPGGDQIEIGEKGINLSGGQKQRVSLARAVYRDSDVYLLDDPLSAVDSHVGKHIFEQVIGPAGLLKNKTRVLVTHGITFLPSVDLVVVLKAGEVSETGTYQQLVQSRGAFSEFLDQHLQDIVASDAPEESLEEVKRQLESTLGKEEAERKLNRAISQVSETRSLVGSTGGTATPFASRSGSVRSRRSGGGSVRRRRNSPGAGKQPAVSGQKLIEAERVEQGTVKAAVFTYYVKAMGLALALQTAAYFAAMQVFQSGENVWLSVWSENQLGVVDETTGVTSNPQDMYLGVYGGMGLGQAIFSFLGTLAVSLGALHASAVLHADLLCNVMRLPQSLFDTTPSGRILNRFSSDVNVLDLSFPMLLRMSIPNVFKIVGTIIIISYTTPIFLAVVVPIGVIYYFLQRVYAAAIRQVRRIESASKAPIFSHFEESITGATTIRAYKVQSTFINTSDRRVDTNQRATYPTIICSGWLTLRVEVVGAFVVFFASLFAVLNRGSTNAGLVGLSVSYALQFTSVLTLLVRSASDIESNIVAVERIKEYTKLTQEAPWELPEQSVPSNWPQEGRVEFRNYQLRYREGLDLVLKGINLTINGGEKVGIVGRTGAGKSSLTLALFRIVEPAGGTIYIDGVDVTAIGLHALRSRITIIPQDPVLFSGTLRLNLDPSGDLPEEALWTALEQAHLNESVASLPAGLDFEVSESGENFSVGQRQLICLARALLRKTKVLVLDEATAAVDLETDDLIQATIRVAFKECTVLTIAHRLNTILDSNRVMVLDKGYVIEFEPPEKLLLNTNSVFYGMAKDAGLV